MRKISDIDPLYVYAFALIMAMAFVAIKESKKDHTAKKDDSSSWVWMHPSGKISSESTFYTPVSPSMFLLIESINEDTTESK